jgi:nicotinic acid mononucleotide adenylyltransferase
MLTRELFTFEPTAIVAFGRFQPPTIGHLSLIETIRSLKGDHYLFLSHTQNAKTDPLDYQTKKQFVESCFPDITVGHDSVRTIIQALQQVEHKGYKNLIYVAGSDRVDSFRSLIEKYNGKEYNFNNINVVSAGERDPDADGVAGMSASKLREAVKLNNFTQFEQGLPNKAIARSLFAAIQRGMLIES